MKINKDTAKAVNAAKTLIEYCARYKECRKCVFYHDGCSIGYPFEYKMIFSPFEEKGAQYEKET